MNNQNVSFLYKDFVKSSFQGGTTRPQWSEIDILLSIFINPWLLILYSTTHSDNEAHISITTLPTEWEWESSITHSNNLKYMYMGLTVVVYLLF